MDTLAIARELRAAELPQQQADAIAAAIGRSIEDAAATKSDLESVRFALKADIDNLRVGTKADTENLEQRLRGEMSRLHSQLLTWFIGTQVAVGALIIAIIKL